MHLGLFFLFLACQLTREPINIYSYGNTHNYARIVLVLPDGVFYQKTFEDVEIIHFLPFQSIDMVSQDTIAHKRTRYEKALTQESNIESRRNNA